MCTVLVVVHAFNYTYESLTTAMDDFYCSMHVSGKSITSDHPWRISILSAMCYTLHNLQYTYIYYIYYIYIYLYIRVLQYIYI